VVVTIKFSWILFHFLEPVKESFATYNTGWFRHEFEYGNNNMLI